MPRKTFTFDGKRYFIRAATDSELAAKIALKRRDLEEGLVVINKSTTVKRWGDQWLETYKRPKIGDATYYAYTLILKNHIYPEIGHMSLSKVRPIHLQKILNLQAGMSADHIKKIRYTLKQLFEDAAANKLVIACPADTLVTPKGYKKTRRAITEAERTHILKVAEAHHAGLWVLTMLYCGLRPQETAALQGRHVDLKDRVLRIEQALKKHTNEIGELKTDTSRREVPLPDALAGKYTNLKTAPYAFVFHRSDGAHLTAKDMQRWWKHFEQELNISMGTRIEKGKLVPPFRVADDLVPYCLRHTFCTDLQSAGVPINVAKELMGHSSIETTSKIYTHKSEVSFANARDLINQFHSEKRDKTEGVRAQRRAIRRLTVVK